MIHDIYSLLTPVNSFSLLMLGLVLFIGACVVNFSYRYLQGSSKYVTFLMQLILLVISVCVMVTVNHILVFFLTWCFSNFLLIGLMVYKTDWHAATMSGLLAAKNYLFGAICLATALIMLYLLTGETHLQTILHQTFPSNAIFLVLLLILLCAMTQSAIWPFHRWLISSLNSPTPVSAIMHAGLVNGGGILLIHFAPLYLHYPKLLTAIFILGLTSALLGTLWKLIQSDVKRMLACSTMGQMGFMLAQCGLGLFPAAAAHLVWHGMFKAYLFLASNSAAQEKRINLNYPPRLTRLMFASCCGILASVSFGYSSGNSWFAGNSTLVLMVLVLITGSQFALALLRENILHNLPLAAFISAGLGLIYGGSVKLMAWLMQPLALLQPQPLNIFHLIGIAALLLTWLAMVLIKTRPQTKSTRQYWQKAYVIALNSSQPKPTTVTSQRTNYKY